MTAIEERLAVELAPYRARMKPWTRRFLEDLLYHRAVYQPNPPALTPRQQETLWELASTHRHRLSSDSLYELHRRQEQRRRLLETSLPLWSDSPLEASFRRDLRHQPLAGETRLIYADWLEEQERLLEADCQRWIVRSYRSPERKPDAEAVWHLSHSDVLLIWRGYLAAEVSLPLFHALDLGRIELITRRVYPNPAQAMIDLERAWLRVRLADTVLPKQEGAYV